MAITRDEAQRALTEFLEVYQSAGTLRYFAGRTEEDTFGITDKALTIRAIFYSANSPTEQGMVRFALDRLESAEHFTETLRHEVLGHWAIDTFKPAHKASILYALMLARNQPGLKDVWDGVDVDYQHLGPMNRAEEVWARIAETIEPTNQADLESARDAFRETCLEKSRMMTLRDVYQIVNEVAAEIRDGQRKQLCFPHPLAGNRFAAAEPAKPFREQVVEELIDALKRGTAPWQKPWNPATSASALPTNPTTGKRYRGANALHLMMQGRGDSRWMTYKQANSIGAQVRKGEKGTRIEYWQFEDERALVGSDGRPVVGADGRPVMRSQKLERPRVFTAYVFNGEQIEGLPEQEVPAHGWANQEKAEAILQGSGARIVHSGQYRAFYRPSTDEIHLPRRDQFPNSSDYYAVALHELGHWTGHSSRLGRDLSHPFGSEGYAREELRAEIASMVIGRELGIGQDPSRHASYVASWVKILQDDSNEIFRAASAAEKILEYVLAFSQVQSVGEQVAAQVSKDASGDEGTKMRERLYAEIPAGHEAEAAALGGTYDKEVRLWWFDGGTVPTAVYDRWPVQVGIDDKGQRLFQKLPTLDVVAERGPIYIAVPFDEKDQARALGARWDREVRSWYIPAGVKESAFSQWPVKGKETVRSPQEEFAEFLEGLGFTLKGLPVMDGRSQRAPTIGDEGDETSGTYIGYLNGHPAGYGTNHRTKDEGRWKSTSRVLSNDSRGVFLADAVQQRALRAKERDQKYERAAAKMEAKAAELFAEKAADTPYVKAKGLCIAGPLLADEAGETLYVPGFDADGKMWTMQMVTPDGAKVFAKGSRKTGCFFPLGSRDELARAPVIVIAEGLSTAATVREATGYATVAAFDAGNLRPVAEALREKFPEKPIVIAGDDDRALVMTLGKNVGREKAEAAAAAVGGKAIFAVFAASENEYPVDLKKVTPETYKAHEIASKTLRERTNLSTAEREELQGRLLDTEQLDALARIKRYTDWNDLAHHGRGGMAAVERQLSAALKPVIEQESVSRERVNVAELEPRRSELMAGMSAAGRTQTRG